MNICVKRESYQARMMSKLASTVSSRKKRMTKFGGTNQEISTVEIACEGGIQLDRRATVINKSL
jgi:hypothetical protein